MAKYWVGGTGNSNDPTNHWATVSGGAPGAGNTPTAADDVFVDASSGAGTLTLNASLACRSFQTAGSSIATLTHNAAVNLTMGDGTAGAGSKALDLSGITTYNLGSTTTSALIFASTSATQQTITTAAKVLGNLTWNTAGNYLFNDDLTSTAGTLTHSAGTLNTNSKTVACSTFTSTAGTRSLTFGTSIFNAGVAFALSGAGLTVSAASSTINLLDTGNSNSSITAGLITLGTINLNATGATRVAVALSTTIIGTLTFTNTAIKTANFRVDASTTGQITNLTVTGNSAINRILIFSNLVGSPRTFPVTNAPTLSNVDFTDIVGSSGSNWTGTSLGNALGNSGITFDTPVTQTHTASAGGNWSDATKWTSRVPLPQDDVVVDATTTGTLTADMQRLGANVTFTGFAGTYTSAITVTMFGDLAWASGMSMPTTASFICGGRGNHTITSAGKTYAGLGFSIIAHTGTYTLNDAFVGTGAAGFLATSGTFASAGFSLTCQLFTAANLATIVLSTSTINLTRTTAGNIWNGGASAMSAASSTIVVSTVSANARNFVGNGFTYGTLTYTVAGSTGGLVIVSTGNTFDTINFSDVTNTRQLTLPPSTNITGSFNVNGTSGKLMTIVSQTPGSQTVLFKDSGTVSIDYVTITDNNAIGGAVFTYGVNSSGSNVTGWNLAASASGALLSNHRNKLVMA